jgi:type II secretory pathway component PulF
MNQRFSYEALDAAGRRVVDSSEARSREDLLIQLQGRGLVLLRWLDGEKETKNLFKRGGRGIRSKELLLLTQEMAHLMKSGLPVDRALNIIVQSSDSTAIRSTAAYLRQSIQAGSSLSDAMALKKHDFSELYINMVRVGEMGGILPQVLGKLAGFMERTEEIKRFILSSSIYPSILMSIGILSVVIIMGFVVPKFATIFHDMGQNLPASTELLIQVSQFLRDWWWLILAGILLSAGSLWWYVGTPGGKDRMDRLLIRLPGMGTLLMDIQVSRFARTLGTLVQSGVPLLKALSIVRDVVGNIVVKAAAEEIYRKVKEGKRVSQLMKDQSIFPAMAVQMVALGEETGKIGEMLSTVADDLDVRIQSRIKTYLGLLEPFAILAMGLIIGGVVISMLTAIFGLNEIEF